MSYWEDKRDDLEILYPTCTSFCSFSSIYKQGLIESVGNGLILIMTFGSDTSALQFQKICYRLEDSIDWNTFTFLIIDADAVIDTIQLQTIEPLSGNGEVFAVKDSRIIGSMGACWSEPHFERLIAQVINTNA